MVWPKGVKRPEVIPPDGSTRRGHHIGRRPGNGGAREGSGRPKGQLNYTQDLIALLEQMPHGRKKRRALDVARMVMNDLASMLEIARDKHSAIYLRIAKLLTDLSLRVAEFEQPRLQAIAHAKVPQAHTDIVFSVFERDRKPLAQREPPLIEAQPVNTDAVNAEPVNAAPAEPIEQPGREKPEPQATPPPEDRRAPLSWSHDHPKSLYDHPAMLPWRHGSRH
jgi:hypothetical protein